MLAGRDRENSALTTRHGFNSTPEEAKRLPGKNVIPRPDESETSSGLSSLPGASHTESLILSDGIKTRLFLKPSELLTRKPGISQRQKRVPRGLPCTA